MKDKICATLTKDHNYICSTSVIGRSGENECTQLEITLDECLCDKWVYIDFINTDGNKYKTPRLEIVDNKVIYDIPNILLSERGYINVQVVLQDEIGEVWKSDIKSYDVNPSINATDDIPNQEDFITEAQKTLDDMKNLKEEVENGLTPTIGDNENWYISGKDTGKLSRGQQGLKGDKGDKGDPGQIKMIVVQELPKVGNEDTIYLVPNKEPEEQNNYDEYVYTNSSWEKIGGASVQVDLTDYVKSNDVASQTKTGVIKAWTSTNEDGEIGLNISTEV